MHIGGVQKSLVNLLGEISDKHEITLLLFYGDGELKNNIPSNVNIIYGNKFTQIMGMSQQEAKNSGILTLLWRSFWTVLTKIFGIGLSFKILSKMQKVHGKYDVGVSFMQNSDYKMFYGGCNEFVINSVKADKKISFVHCDFKNYFGNNKYNRSYYKNFDKIACVSNSCKKVFDGICPEYKDKTFTVYNCYDFSDMKMQSKAYSADYTEGILNIFSAARISEEKGIFRMIPIFADFKSKGGKFIWRIAGAGPLLNDAQEACKKYGIDDCVVFLGMLDNPYPYFVKSDMLLVPSYDEAAPMVFGEAAFFGLPVFTTNTTSAVEMVKNGNLGIVCENTDEAIRSGLYEIIKNPNRILSFAGKTEASNTTALEQFENLIM